MCAFLRLPLPFLRALTAGALPAFAVGVGGCSNESEKPRVTAADQTGFLQPAENWRNVIMHGGGLARLPRAGETEAAAAASADAGGGIINLATVPLTRRTRSPDRDGAGGRDGGDSSSTAAGEDAAAFAALPPVELAPPPVWVEAQRQRAIETARAQRTAAAAASASAATVLGTGGRTVRLFVQPAAAPSQPAESAVAALQP